MNFVKILIALSTLQIAVPARALIIEENTPETRELRLVQSNMGYQMKSTDSLNVFSGFELGGKLSNDSTFNDNNLHILTSSVKAFANSLCDEMGEEPLMGATNSMVAKIETDEIPTRIFISNYSNSIYTFYNLDDGMVRGTASDLLEILYEGEPNKVAVEGDEFIELTRVISVSCLRNTKKTND